MAIDFGMVKIKVLSRYEPSKKMHPKAFIYITLNFPTTHPPIYQLTVQGKTGMERIMMQFKILGKNAYDEKKVFMFKVKMIINCTTSTIKT